MFVCKITHADIIMRECSLGLGIYRHNLPTEFLNAKKVLLKIFKLLDHGLPVMSTLIPIDATGFSHYHHFFPYTAKCRPRNSYLLLFHFDFLLFCFNPRFLFINTYAFSNLLLTSCIARHWKGK